MLETLRDLPKNDPLRLAVAEQIRFARSLDRSKEYLAERSLKDYEKRFQGLSAFLEYIKNLNSKGKILDIGAGKVKAAYELSRSVEIDDLSVIATLLTPLGKESPNMGSGAIIATSTENLYEIEDNSISGVLSCFGLAYSASPEHTIRRVDRVLIPGAAIKAIFYGGDSPYTGALSDGRGLRRSDRFKDELGRLNYDMATEAYLAGEIVTAIKPGKGTTSATDLFNNDKRLYEQGRI